MLERRADRGAELLGGKEVADGVVDEHRVEGPAQPDRSHVALEVFALRIDRPRDIEHGRRQVDERHVEPFLHVGGIVPSPRAKFEDGPRFPGARLPQHSSVEIGLLPVLIRRGEQVEPAGEVAEQSRRRVPGHVLRM